jgi:hypothetical protein
VSAPEREAWTVLARLAFASFIEVKDPRLPLTWERLTDEHRLAWGEVARAVMAEQAEPGTWARQERAQAEALFLEPATKLARWITRRWRGGGRPKMHYGLYVGASGNGERLWGRGYVDTPNGRRSARRRMEQQTRFFEGQGYRVLPYVSGMC